MTTGMIELSITGNNTLATILHIDEDRWGPFATLQWPSFANLAWWPGGHQLQPQARTCHVSGHEALHTTGRLHWAKTLGRSLYKCGRCLDNIRQDAAGMAGVAVQVTFVKTRPSYWSWRNGFCFFTLVILSHPADPMTTATS